MLKVGLTGGIGSGKSMVASVFIHLGVPVFFSDQEAAWIMNNHAGVKHELQNNFGEDILNHDGIPDRKKLRELIFKNETAKRKVNELVHPIVRERFVTWCNERQYHPFVVKEAAILFESGAYAGLDKYIVVVAPEKLRLNRVVKRDRLDPAQVKAIMATQWSDEEKVKRAHFVIVNDEKHLVLPQVLQVFYTIKQLTAAV